MIDDDEREEAEPNDETEAEVAAPTGGVATLVTVRSDRNVAWTLAGIASAIIAVLVVVGRVAPPWTLEGLLVARVAPAAGVRTVRDRDTVSDDRGIVRGTASDDRLIVPDGASDDRLAARRTASGDGLAERADAALTRNDVSDESKLALIDELAHDPRDAATETLLKAARHPSLLLSMAALKGLTGRSCARLEPDLGELLRDDDWQRRAWAAKVLGDSGCERAGEALTGRWHAEPDGRVREQIADAMSALKASETR